MIKVRRLEPTDDRSGLHADNPDLDRFFIRYAGQNQFRHHVGTTYIAVEDDRISGFVTVAPSQIEIDDLPRARRKRLPRYPLPVLRLARLAVDKRARGKGIGRLLLRSVLVLARQMATSLGCIGVVVDAKPEAMDFYKRYGFEPLEVLQGALGDRPEPISLFLPLSAVPEQKGNSRIRGRLSKRPQGHCPTFMRLP